jgi:hypothetical protein
VWDEALSFSAVKYAIPIEQGAVFSPVDGPIETPMEQDFMFKKQAE